MTTELICPECKQVVTRSFPLGGVESHAHPYLKQPCSGAGLPPIDRPIIPTTK